MPRGSPGMCGLGMGCSCAWADDAFLEQTVGKESSVSGQPGGLQRLRTVED